MAEDLKKMYRTIMDDHFPPKMEISFINEDKRQTLFYEKVTWTIDEVQKGLRKPPSIAWQTGIWYWAKPKPSNRVNISRRMSSYFNPASIRAKPISQTLTMPSIFCDILPTSPVR